MSLLQLLLFTCISSVRRAALQLQSLLSFSLRGNEQAVSFDCGFPSGVLSDHVSQKSNHIVDWKSDLLHGVELTDRDCVVLECPGVNSHSEGNTALIGSGVATAHRLGRVINLARDAGTHKLFLYKGKQIMTFRNRSLRASCEDFD